MASDQNFNIINAFLNFKFKKISNITEKVILNTLNFNYFLMCW